MREEIKKIFQQVLDLSDVTDNIAQENCVEWDSMHHLNLIIALEAKFGVSFEPEDFAELKSLDAIEKKLNIVLSPPPPQ